MTRSLTTVLAALVAALLAAAPALGTEGMTGVTDTGELAVITTQAPGASTRPAAVGGLARGERLIAIAGRTGAAGDVTVAVGSSARLYRVAGRTATPVGAPFATGLRGTRFSLAAAPGADRAHLVSDVGQHLLIDLATGAAADGPVLRTVDGRVIAPAVAMGADGRLVGVDGARRELVEETAPGSAAFTAQPLAFAEPGDAAQVAEPLSLAVAGGRAYLASAVTFRDAVARQSRVFVLDGARVSSRQLYLRRQFVALAATGPVPDDRRVEATVRLRPAVSVSALLRDRFPADGLVIRTPEPVLAYTASLRLDGRVVAFGIGGALDGVGRVRLGVGDTLRGTVRRAVGRRGLAHVTLTDAAGNRRVVVRRFRFVR